MAQKRPKGVGDAGTQKPQRLNIRLTPEQYKRLGVHAIYMRLTPGELVGQLIDENLRAWKVQVNSVASSDRPAPAVESSPAILPATL
jgi:hypothetical protein